MGNVLNLLIAILVIGWLIGFVGYNAGGLIHLLLVIAVVALLLRVISGKVRVTKPFHRRYEYRHQHFPFIYKWSLLLVGFYVLISMLSIGQAIILPVIYATILAILISPLVNYLERKKINRGLAIASVLVFAIMIIGGIVFLVVSQSNLLIEAMPELIRKT